MAEFLEDFDDFYYNRQITNTSQSTLQSTLQMIDLAEREGFEFLEISDVEFPNEHMFARVSRLEKVKKIKIINTNIRSFDNIPPNVTEIFIKKGNMALAQFNNISQNVTKIEIINNRLVMTANLYNLVNLTFLDLSQNNIHGIPKLPVNLKTFIATHNKIKEIQNLNDNLMELNLSNNLIEQVCNIPLNIELLNVSRNLIKYVDLSSFNNLKVFKAYNNFIDLIIGPISPKMEVFDVFNNQLTQVPELGINIKEIDLSNNDLKRLPKFGLGVIERVDITKNPLLELNENEIFTLIELNKIHGSLVVICDQFEIPHGIPASRNSSSSSSSSSSLDMTNIFDEVDDEPVNVKDNGRQLDILEFLTRKKHLTSTPSTPSICIIRGGSIHKRRTYEL